MIKVKIKPAPPNTESTIAEDFAQLTEQFLGINQMYLDLLKENEGLKQQVNRLSALPQIIRDEVHYHISALDSDILFESAKKEVEALRLRADMLENACRRYEKL